MSKRLIVYDLDGTLIDSANTVLSIINAMRLESNQTPIDKAKLTPWISLGGISLISNALEINADNAHSALGEFRRRYVDYKTSESDLYPRVREVLEQFSQKDILLALCTNKPRNLVDRILQELSLVKYFDCVVAGGDLPSQKPDPLNLLTCLNYYGTGRKETILVGDSTIDQKLAISCDVPFVFFRGGYDDGVDISLVDRVIDCHSDLL
ncbi:HAD hydrolase-like protein [Polynucleobacter necessarius]|uniref:HAD hydrolase-like protein n=1 Tax=Polynucleobacter necessarius TaxID=576610 RepID=UPI0013B05E0E|nr:HAD hydrolase-like protein [Polynucleobacter necessarius]